MIGFRPFRNNDPPAISEIWCSQPPQRGLMQPMTPAVLDQLVLGRPFFEREGLIVAVEDGRPIGFVHGGFGASPDGSCLDYERGVISLLMVAPHAQSDQVGAELLQRGEAYLVSRGAKTLFGGATESLGPFYFGLYGGSRLGGVLQSDVQQTRLLLEGGYRPTATHRILQCELGSCRTQMTREIMQLRRQCRLERAADPPPANWWEAGLLSYVERVRFEFLPKGRDEHLGSVSFWGVEPLASSWGVHAMGLWQLAAADNQRSETLVEFLLGESLRELKSVGVTLVEVLVGSEDSELIGACGRLGFHEVDQVVEYRKPPVGGG